MDIKELTDFKLSDAIKFHNTLNPAIWTEKGKLDPEVKDQLMLIAKDFLAELGIGSLKVEDITISGSNAAYSYTPHSDLDLHILVDFKKLSHDEVYQELFKAKKTLYNDTHDIKVRGVPVELYVQDSNEPVESLGEYSILKNDWIKIPKKGKANFNQAATKLKYEKLGELIELATQTKDTGKIDKALDVIKRYRKAGLTKTGEFGPENLAFKALRKQGMIQKLFDIKNDLHSDELSLNEILNTKTKSPFYKFDGGPLDRAVPFKTKSGNRYEIEFINVLDAYSRPRLRQFPKIKPKLIYYKDEIIDNGVEVVFRQDDYMLDNPAGITGAGSAAEVFGIVTNKIIEFIEKFNPPYLYFTSYDDEPSRIKLYNALLRRVVPTLPGYFYKVIKIENSYQFVILDSDFFQITNVTEQLDKPVPTVDGLIQQYGEQKVLKQLDIGVKVELEHTNNVQTALQIALAHLGEDINYYTKLKKAGLEEASGYIPSEKEKNDPRFKTALTVDVKPDSIKKNAKAFGWKVSRSGIPPLLRK